MRLGRDDHRAFAIFQTLANDAANRIDEVRVILVELNEVRRTIVADTQIGHGKVVGGIIKAHRGRGSGPLVGISYIVSIDERQTSLFTETARRVSKGCPTPAFAVI